MIYDMITEPCDAQYRALMDYAMAHSDAVMLVFSVKKGSKLQNDTKRTVRNQLAPWRIKSRHDAQWPVTTSYDTRYLFTIDLYKPSQEVIDYVLSKNSLYSWGENGDPCDIAFFRENECWMATCSHEKFGWLVLEEEPSASFMQCLKPIPHPNDIEFQKNDPRNYMIN